MTCLGLPARMTTLTFLHKYQGSKPKSLFPQQAIEPPPHTWINANFQSSFLYIFCSLLLFFRLLCKVMDFILAFLHRCHHTLFAFVSLPSSGKPPSPISLFFILSYNIIPPPILKISSFLTTIPFLVYVIFIYRDDTIYSLLN